MSQRRMLFGVLLLGLLLGGVLPVHAQVKVTKEGREITTRVVNSEYFAWAFGGVSTRHTGSVWLPQDVITEAEFLTFIEYEDGTVMIVFSSDIERWFGMGVYGFIHVTGPAFVHVSDPGKGRVRGTTHRVSAPEDVRNAFRRQGAVVIRRGVRVTFDAGTGGHGKIREARHFRFTTMPGRHAIQERFRSENAADSANAWAVDRILWTSAQDARPLSEDILKSPYFFDVFGRLEDQHDELVWLPADRLDAATFLVIVEYERKGESEVGPVFVCFTQYVALQENERGQSVVIGGPAVIYPVLPGGGEAKFKNNRYVGFKGKKADWSKRDRHFFDDFVRVTFEDGTGGHGNVALIQMFRMRGDEDRRNIAKLMGVYFPGPVEEEK